MGGKPYRLEEITGLDLDNLPRENTLIIIPVGILEYHAHHLPYGTDLFENNAVTELIINNIKNNLKDLNIILYPNIPLGVFGIENLSPSKFPTIGSFVINRKTLTDLLAELIGKFAQFQFMRSIIISFHGAPEHCSAINDASDRAFLEFGAKTLPVLNYLWFPLFFGGKLIAKFESKMGRKFTNKEKEAVLHFVHAEAVETSAMLYLKPEFVDKKYKDLKPVVFEYDEMFDKIKELEDWHGYVGVPSVSKRDIGKAIIETVADECTSLIIRFLKNDDLKSLRRYPEGL